MFKPNNNVYLVFDDGGLITSNPDGTGYNVDFLVYERILELAKRHKIKIPIACVASFFDINRIYHKSIINKDAEKILKLVDENKDYLEIWNHGLTHMYKSEYTEFGLYNNSEEKVPDDVQEVKIKLSQAIFNSLGFIVNTFVPPGHAWEQNITDKLAGKYGIDAIAVREFEKTGFKYWMKHPRRRYIKTWNHSEYLETYFRLGLGIGHDITDFNKNIYFKTNLFIQKGFFNIITNRKIMLKYPASHYFAHVQNMNGNKSMDYFGFVVEQLKKIECAE